ncbi:hypothetical protein EMMF5_002314 [Cystobasidiomycetes sp. EMM_F5]
MPVLTVRGLADARQLLHSREEQLRTRLARHGELVPTPLPSPSVESGEPTQAEHETHENQASAAEAHIEQPRIPQTSSHKSRSRRWGLAEYGIPPPSPDIGPDPTLDAKLRHFHSLRAQGIRFNATLQANKSFRNPSILQKLVDFVAVDEKKSAFPAQVWESSAGMGADAWADAIAETQKQKSEERQKAQERGKRSNIEFESSSQSSSSKDRYSRSLDNASSTSSRYSTLPVKDREDRKRSRWDSDAGRRDDHRNEARPGDRHRERSRSPRRHR